MIIWSHRVIFSTSFCKIFVWKYINTFVKILCDLLRVKFSKPKFHPDGLLPIKDTLTMVRKLTSGLTLTTSTFFTKRYCFLMTNLRLLIWIVHTVLHSNRHRSFVYLWVSDEYFLYLSPLIFQYGKSKLPFNNCLKRH